MALSLLVFICLVGAALAGPFQRDVERHCATECPAGANEKFDYQPGNKYVYRFHGMNYITVAGDRKQVIEQSGTVEIHVLDKCEMLLQLRDVHLVRDDKEEEDSDLQEKLQIPLSFSWLDGKIEHICADPEESTDSENIKKGILSAIINTMPDWKSSSRHQEVDSLGTCDTTYSIVRKDKNGVTIKKEKTLKSCDNRQNGFNALITEAYSSPDSDIKSVPILSNERIVCEQQIRDRVIQRVVCKETGAVKPLAQQESMLEFQAQLELNLQGVQQSSGMSPRSQTERKNILYNHDQDQDVESREKHGFDLLAELCPLTEGVLHPKVSKIYYQLINVLKGLPAHSIRKIYESLKRHQICHTQKTLDIFLDALPMAGTEGAIQLMVDLLKNKEVGALKSKLWPASFALIPNPNAEAISAVLPLLEDQQSIPVLLGLSAMIHRVCSYSNCDQIPSVRDAVRILKQSLGDDCSSDNDNAATAILKAFGNMGYLGDAESAILKCATLKDKPIMTRLAAVDAFRRYKKQVPSELVRMYADSQENFEVRIAALSTIIKNADSHVVQAIQDVIERDQDEQVVAYTMSLVNNWKRTSSPLKQSVSELLQAIELKRDDVKYWENSKHIEISSFNTPMNLGASLESNIIHSSQSKLPRSVSSRIDVDLFGRNINLFEFGVRAEGLEKSLKKLFGMQQESNERKSWFALQSRQDSESERPEASFYLRSMGTEFMDMSVSEFTSVGKMVQVADLLSKLAQGKKADFAHSFLFLNTRLVVQSVTGRSYTFGMTGSATAALTADGKFDILNLLSSPSNCDIEGRLQPSANLEFAATVGIHSEKSRPDIKIVTSFNTGSDLGAKLRVKDSHLAEARLDMPSEELQILKIRSELFEVDANQNEKRIIDQMEKKFDTCIKALEKPLGLQICGQLEIPKPFVSRKFPYTHGIGNIQLSIRKTDPSMKGYMATLEIPRRTSDSMTYRLTVDTPGSSIKRTFQANLDVKRSQSGEHAFKLDLQSPFKEISTTGSCTLRKDLVQGTINILSDRSQRYSAKAIVEIESSPSKKAMKPTLQWTMPGQEPVSVSGTIVLEDGRKQLFTFDLRSNKPENKPFVFSGSLMKEGAISFSKSSQWKMSADIIAKTPIITTKSHSTLAKRSGQSHTVSSSFSLDYSTPRYSKQSIKFVSEVHQSSAKLGATAEFESTQLPQCNWVASWDMQGRLKAAVKNDLTVKYGQHQEQSYIQMSQTYQHGDRSSLSEGTLSVKAPQFGVDSDLRIAADLHAQEKSNFHVEAELRYKADKRIKSLIHLRHLSQKPIKMSVKAELEYPGRKMMYEDEIVETSPDVYEGQSKLQWQRNQQASLTYTYKKINDHSFFHHELESVLTTPFMRSPLKHKGIIKLSRENVQFKTQIVADRRSSYYVEAQLSRKGSSFVQVKVPVVEGKIALENESRRKSANIDIQLKSRNPRHILGSLALSWDAKKSVEAELSWDADRSPSKKLAVKAEMEISQKRSRSSYNIESSLQILDHLSLQIASVGEDGQDCKHQLSIDADGKNFEPVGITVHQEITKSSVHSIITYKKRQAEKLQAEIHAKWASKSSGKEFQASASIKSPDNSFQDKEMSIRHVFSKSGSAVRCHSVARMELESGKSHETKIEYTSTSRQSKELKIAVKTPYRQFADQEIVLSYNVDSDSKTVSAAIDSNGKKVLVSSVLRQAKNEISITSTIRSPYSVARDVKLYAALEHQRSQKHAESHLEINGERKYDVSASYKYRQGRREIESHMKTIMTPEISIMVKSEDDHPSFSHELQITKDSARILSGKISKQSSSEEFTSQLEIKTHRNTLVDLKVVHDAKNSNNKKYVLKANGQFTPVSLSLQSTQNEEGSIGQTLQICRGESERECYNVKGYYKQETESDKYDKYRKITFDIEKVNEQGSVKHLCNVHYLLSIQDRSIKSKLLLESQQKKIGYEIQLKSRRNDDEPCQLEASIHLPSRTIQATANALHASAQSLYEIELVPDVSQNSQKLSFQFKKQHSSSDNKLSGQMALMHPALQKPFTVRYSLTRPQSSWPTDASFEIDYSRDSKDKLVAEMSLQLERSRQRQQSFSARIQSQGSDLDLAVKMSRQPGNSNDLYICEWSWQSERGLKKGELKAKLAQGSDQKQRSELTYKSDSSQLTLEAQTTWTSTLPSEIRAKLSSKNELLADVQYQRRGPCFEVEIKHSAPVWKHQLCINQMENRSLKMISFEAYHQEKCMEFSLQVDPSKARVAHITAQWDKQELKQALMSLKKFKPLLSALSTGTVKQELRRKYQTMRASLQQHLLKPLAAAAYREMQAIARELRQSRQLLKYLPQLPKLPSLEQFQKEVQQRADQLLQRCRRQVQQYLREDAPEWLKELYEQAKIVIEKFWKEYCHRNSLCYKIKSAYERHGMKQVRRVVRATFDEKVRLVQKSSQVKYNRAVDFFVTTIKVIYDWTEEIRHLVELRLPALKNTVLYKKLAETYQKSKEYVQNRCREYYDEFIERFSEFLDKVMGNEIVQTFVETFKQAKTDTLRTLKQMDLRHEMWETFKTNMQKYPKNWLKEKIQVNEFDTEHGRINIQFANPLNRSRVQLLRNAIFAAKNKLTAKK